MGTNGNSDLRFVPEIANFGRKLGKKMLAQVEYGGVGCMGNRSTASGFAGLPDMEGGPVSSSIRALARTRGPVPVTALTGNGPLSRSRSLSMSQIVSSSSSSGGGSG